MKVKERERLQEQWEKIRRQEPRKKLNRRFGPPLSDYTRQFLWVEEEEEESEDLEEISKVRNKQHSELLRI